MSGETEKGPAAHWFRPHRYGFGASPSSWQGWAVLIAFPVISCLVALGLFAGLPPVVAVVVFLIFMAAATIAFVLLVKRKTGGEWRWRWGDRGEIGR